MSKHKKYEDPDWEEKSECFSIRMEPSVKKKLQKIADKKYSGNMSKAMIELIKDV